ncbi:MAG: tetratricopeptide repeat protein [Elusimicrobia bacterium]|nr:tetratricopeptide repeat protein [Elusimicrobiota bacterium]
MTRKWVKDELRNNPLERLVYSGIDYIKNNRNNFLMGLAVTGVIGLFAGVIVKNRISENREASRIFAIAQNDFYRFNYGDAIEKFSTIEKSFGSSRIVDQVGYLKGLSYYRQGNLPQAKATLEKILSEHKKSKFRAEIIISLAAVCEDMQEYEKALELYDKIEEGNYLKPEALTGKARIYEIKNDMESAIGMYTGIQSHYTNTYWGTLASERLAALGVSPKPLESGIPDIDVK